jgi:acyl-CoA synthetase (AMP-forming)/AMP-acid ligase II
MRAIERTSSIGLHPKQTFASVVRDVAEKFGDMSALVSDRERLTYRELVERSNKYTRWAFDQGLGKGQTVCLLMPNRPEYMAIWLGITQTGAGVALLNTNLKGSLLAHCLEVADPEIIIVDTDLIDTLSTALLSLQGRCVFGPTAPTAARSRASIRISSDITVTSSVSVNNVLLPSTTGRSIFIHRGRPDYLKPRL